MIFKGLYGRTHRRLDCVWWVRGTVDRLALGVIAGEGSFAGGGRKE